MARSRRSGAIAPYTDTAALNDIHVLLTSTDPGDGTLADIAAILARTGRPLIPARDIETTTAETALGWPVACVDAGDTTVFVRQAPAGAGLVVEICTKTDAEQAALAVTPRRPLPAPGRAVPRPGRLTGIPGRIVTGPARCPHPLSLLMKGPVMTTDADTTHEDPAIERPGTRTAPRKHPGQRSGDSPPWRAMIAVSAAGRPSR